MSQAPVPEPPPGPDEDETATETEQLLPCDHAAFPPVERSASKGGCLSGHGPTVPSPVTFVRDLSGHFGYKLLVILFVAQHLLKGFANSFVGAAMPYLYKMKNVSGPRQQILAGIASLPWAMKPVIGLLSDNCPVFGLKKAPYMVAMSALGIGAFTLLGFGHLESMSVNLLVTCFFLVNLQLSTCDLLTEAKYAAKIRDKPDQGPNLLTYVWFGINFAGMAATVIAGPAMERFGNRAPFLISLPVAALILFPTLANYLEEEGGRRASPDRTGQAANGPAKPALHCSVTVWLSVLMFVGTSLLTVVGITCESVALNALASILVAAVILVAFSVSLSPMMAKVNAFFLIQTSLGLGTGGASFYFFTDGPDEFPDGPHFSKVFFVTALGVISSVVSMVGLWTYNRYMQHWSYRHLLLLTNVVAFALGFLDIMIFTRANKRMGIPDHVFVIGSSVSQTLVYQWMWMPGTIFLSQLCPKGMEATMYALLAGCHNLGGTISASCGALLLQRLGVNPSGSKNEGTQFDNLWKASLLASLLSFATCALLPFFIPNVSQTDVLLTGGAATDPAHGSLLRRCCWPNWAPPPPPPQQADCDGPTEDDIPVLSAPEVVAADPTQRERDAVVN